MIRIANESDMRGCIGSEAAIRIVSAYEGYGPDTRFLKIYADDKDTRMSLMDGTAVLHAPLGINEEWQSFLSMHPDIKTVRTDAYSGAVLARLWNSPVKSGDFMSCVGAVDAEIIQTGSARYEALYAFLSDYFALPPFDSWYVDVSHRVRHGRCHIASLVEDGQVICNAMSVAETTSDALLGAVATHPDWRRRGLAGKCINHLISQLSNKRIHISPVDDRAKRLYEKLGFVVTGSWAEVLRV